MDEKKQDLFDRLAVVGKAFASAKRLELVDLLSQGERTVEALAREAGLGVSTASAHLQVLKLSSLVRTRKDGPRVHYRLAGDDVLDLYASLRTVAQEHSADVDRALSAYLGDDVQGDVDEVDRDELLRRLAADEVVLLDVRPAEEFRAGHIEGARSVPFDQVEAVLADLGPDREVVAYCRGAWCVMASDAVRLLRASGRAARRLEGGMLEWRQAGLPVEVGV
ncbi:MULTISPECIES: ArsR/SmtB family transcription factor [Ornithinimicrobium]|uniref:ArsR/SmtB family transcription factor n=1 Tax=Ornithinimicrobium kibberense TaxID=282060 RepID=A0ABV5UZP9_9MICO|nr:MULTISPECIES: metalloregulator ArsR/SmtB family transcription factor [Ornithinimicrobium]OLT22466.1 ArsR family transcriptional regulator [Ornithinimicrobium sp. CNJ-824]